MSKQKSTPNKLIALLNLVLVGLFPMISFIYIFINLILYFFDKTIFIGFMSMSPFVLAYAIIQSHINRYCHYHRGMMYFVLIADIAYYLPFPNILTYNLAILSFLFLSLLCFIKTIQIMISYEGKRKLHKGHR